MLTQLKRRWNEITAHQVSTSSMGCASGVFILSMFLDPAARAMLLSCIDAGVGFSGSDNLMVEVNAGVDEMSKLMGYSEEKRQGSCDHHHQLARRLPAGVCGRDLT